MKVDFIKLLSKAEEFSKKGIDWHHHYLPQGCQLNVSSQHLIILEGESQEFRTEFENKPMEELEKLENLFFKRKK